MLSWLFSEPLPVGTRAPDFTALDDRGRTVKLSSLRGKNVVLVFYPGDNTPVCTAQLCEFRDNWELAEKRNVLVFGVNRGGVESHHGFSEKHRFPFPLIADPGQRVGELYHASGLIVKRTVYLIGPDGTIRYGKRGKPAVMEVLGAAR